MDNLSDMVYAELTFCIKTIPVSISGFDTGKNDFYFFYIYYN